MFPEFPFDYILYASLLSLVPLAYGPNSSGLRRMALNSDCDDDVVFLGCPPVDASGAASSATEDVVFLGARSGNRLLTASAGDSARARGAASPHTADAAPAGPFPIPRCGTSRGSQPASNTRPGRFGLPCAVFATTHAQSLAIKRGATTLYTKRSMSPRGTSK